MAYIYPRTKTKGARSQKSMPLVLSIIYWHCKSIIKLTYWYKTCATGNERESEHCIMQYPYNNNILYFMYISIYLSIYIYI